jgi:formate C-acetyltransferase
MPANSVLDVQIPLARDMTPATLTAVARAFARLGGPTLQPNLVSIETLRDARLHPERHRDLVVRICGLSAYFVSLTPEVQDEIVSRAVSGV